ncbi:hypothetical protein Pfo_010731 [Paulownia fortunei]|nr:hypothetical protein Pfo_010731 [Paulownia fortunei]
MWKGNGELWKEEEQNTHTLCEVWPPQLPHTKEPVRRLCVPRCPHTKIEVVLIAKISFVDNFEHNWSVKAIRRKTTGTGRMRYLRHVAVRFKSNFREGTIATPRKKGAAAAS